MLKVAVWSPIKAGSYCVFRRARSYSVGDTVLINHQEFGKIIKRVVTSDNNTVRVAGENINSVSTERIGHVPNDRILGKLVKTFAEHS